jgi:hypothetical protein
VLGPLACHVEAKRPRQPLEQRLVPSPTELGKELCSRVSHGH